MKRDMNLIRLLLLDLEAKGTDSPEPDLSGYAEEEIVYHSALLVEAGLADGAVIEDSNGFPHSVTLLRPTWQGHDFLDAARHDDIWSKAIGKLEEASTSAPFAILTQILTALLKQKLGL
jgi:hypothetical protein